jgi:hypothetical protein
MGRVILTVLAAGMASVMAASESGAPEKYRDLYDELDKVLAAAEAQIPAIEGKGGMCPLYSTNLTAANANRGPMILEPRVRQGVLVNLDAFKEVGLTAVAISIPYPVLVDNFPRSGEYREFYRWVVEQIRSRGFAVYIESGTAFREPLGKMPVADFYRGLTPERYKREKRQMIDWMVRELAPDYLTVGNEPDTQTMNTGMEFTAERVVEFVNHFIRGLERGKTRIGAGAGTWLPPVYLKRLASETDLDYLDIHIYPISRNFLVPRTVEAAEIAAKSGKGLIIGEAWLYKMRAAELGRPGAEMEMFARDSYSFWQPLDTRFIQAVSRLADAKRMGLVSFFWPQFLFGYAEYTPELDARKPAEIQEAGVRAAFRNILAKKASRVGAALQSAASCRV